MAKHRVTVLGSVGKSILVDDTLSPRMTAAEAAILALQNSSSGATMRHSVLQGLQLGNDHPQYPLSRGRETIRGQWDFTKQIWASLGNAAAPGYAFTAAPDTGLFGSFTAGDPYFSSVVALLHFDGADGGTTFTDSSSYARAVTVTGGAITSTAHPKYGTATAKFPDSAGKATFADAAETRIATGDWTIEFWVYKSVNNADIQIKKNNFTSVYPMQFLLNGAGNINANGADGTGVGVYSLSGSPAPIATWQHVAITRNGSTFRLFQDGVLKSSATYAGTLGENTGVWTFGTASAGDVWIDDFRFTVGVARYTAAFTPPTAALPDSGDVVYESISVDGTERFRFAQLGQLGIGGANYGSAGDYIRSAGASAPPAWTAPQALTRANDTNVTLTLSGSPTTALFGATLLTLGWTGILATTRGGTGLNAYVTGDLLYANAANTLTARGIGATNDVLAVVGGVPTWSQAIAPTWTGFHTFSPAAGAALRAAGASGQVDLYRATATVNRRLSAFRLPAGGGLAFSLYDDAGTFLVNALSIDRNDTAVTGLFLGNSTDLAPVTMYGNLLVTNDNKELQLGASQDLRFYHDGGNSNIRNDTGALVFRSGAAAVGVMSQSGGTQWRYGCQYYGFDTSGFDNVALGVELGVNAGVATLQAYNRLVPGVGNLSINPTGGNVTIGGPVLTTASTTTTAGLRVPHGAAPSAPVNGDIWTTTAGLFVRINGVTVGPLT